MTADQLCIITETYGHDIVDSAFALWDGGWRPEDVDDAIIVYGEDVIEIFEAMRMMNDAGWFE